MEALTYNEDTIVGKVNTLLLSAYNKVTFSEAMGITRPTLNVRLEKANWKRAEVEMINNLFKKFKNGNS